VEGERLRTHSKKGLENTSSFGAVGLPTSHYRGAARLAGFMPGARGGHEA
jgi:hypothetical protein